MCRPLRRISEVSEGASHSNLGHVHSDHGGGGKPAASLSRLHSMTTVTSLDSDSTAADDQATEASVYDNTE